MLFTGIFKLKIIVELRYGRALQSLADIQMSRIGLALVIGKQEEEIYWVWDLFLDSASLFPRRWDERSNLSF